MRLRPPTVFSRQKNRIWPFIAAIVVLATLLLPFNPVKAAAPAMTNITSGTVVTTTNLSPTFTFTFSGPSIALYSTIVIQLIITTGNPTSGTGILPAITSITDNGAASTIYTKVIALSQTNTFTNTVPVTDTEIWYGQVLGTADSGTVTVTVTVTGSPVIVTWDIGNISTLVVPPSVPAYTTQSSSSVVLNTGTYTQTSPTIPFSSAALVTMFLSFEAGVCSANCINGTPLGSPAWSGGLIAVAGYGLGVGDQIGSNINPCGTVAAATHCGLWDWAAQIFEGSSGSSTFSFTGTLTTMPTGQFWTFGTITIPWVSSSTGTVTNGQSSIGSCPTKNTATFTMVNQTMYMYQGGTLANEAVSTVQVNVASVGGVTGTHTVQLVIYATPAAGPISVSNLFTLVYAHQVALTSGSKNQQVVLSVTGVNFAVAGATWGVGVIGDNKIALNQSSLGGPFSFAGVPVSTASQNSFFTTQGSAFGTDLALCSSAFFQSIITQTVTVTQAATTTVTTTTTSTINTINAQVLFASSQNWPIVFLLLFLPCGILLGVTRNLSGGMVGLLIGSVICLMAGVIPAYIFTGLLIGIIAMMVLIQRSGPNG